MKQIRLTLNYGGGFAKSTELIIEEVDGEARIRFDGAPHITRDRSQIVGSMTVKVEKIQ